MNSKEIEISKIWKILNKPFPFWTDEKFNSYNFSRNKWFDANSGRPNRNKKYTERELRYYRNISYKQMKEMSK